MENRASFFSIFTDDGRCAGFALATAKGYLPVDSSGTTVAAAVATVGEAAAILKGETGCAEF